MLASLLLLAWTAVAAPEQDRHLDVAAAADLKFAMDGLVGAFGKARPGIVVSVSYGSSGNFLSQIQNGAPFDLFFSADIEYPRRLAEAGLAPQGSEFLYAVGRLVVWAPTSSRVRNRRALGRAGLRASGPRVPGSATAT